MVSHGVSNDDRCDINNGKSVGLDVHEALITITSLQHVG